MMKRGLVFIGLVLLLTGCSSNTYKEWNKEQQNNVCNSAECVRVERMTLGVSPNLYFSTGENDKGIFTNMYMPEGEVSNAMLSAVKDTTCDIAKVISPIHYTMTLQDRRGNVVVFNSWIDC